MARLLGQQLREGAGETPPAGAPAAPAAAPAGAPATPPASGVAVGTEPGSAPDKLPPPGLSDEAMAGLLDDASDGIAGASPVESERAPVAAPPAVPPVAAPAAPAAVAPAVPPASPQTPPAAVPQTPAQATPPAQPPAGEQPAAPVQPVAPPPQAPAPQQSPQEIAAAQAARRQEYVTQVEKGYSFTEQQAIEFNANPAAALPKLAAKMQVDMMESTIHGILMQVPAMLENLLVQRETTRRNEDEFYASWPMLDRKNPEHRSAVSGILSAIVQRNPSIARAEAMKQTGAAALVALGIPYVPPVAAPAAPQMPGQPPQAPAAAPAVPAVPPMTGFSPAMPGVGGQGIPGRQGEENPFSKMSREFEEDI